jgi:hypothetical protein
MAWTFTCVWCQRILAKRFHASKDHLKPQCLGKDHRCENLASACKRCNNDRGRITSFYSRKLWLVRQIERWKTNIPLMKEQRPKIERMLAKYKRQLPAMLMEQAGWANMERERIGRSFSDAMDLSAPELPAAAVKGSEIYR